MTNGNSTLPPIQPGDPSDIQKRIESFKTPIVPSTGKIKLERAPGNQFQNTPFNAILDAPKIIGSQGWLFDLTNPTTEGGAIEPGVVRNIAETGVNVADPRVIGDQSKFLNENMKLWETSGDRWRNAIFGGMAQGINRLGEDFGALLGGSLWGEDFERSAMERYFAGSRATLAQASTIYDDDSRFYEGLQGAIASITEFAALGGAVAKGTRAVVSQIPKVTKAVQGSRVTTASFDANGLTQTIGATTRVSEQVAATGSKLSNWFIRNQNLLAQAGSSLPAGILQNRFEGTAMALQTRQEILEKLSPAVEKGDLTYEQAERIANQEANGVRSMNSAMVVQDIFQHALLFRARGVTRSGYQRPGFTWNPKQYLKNTFGSTKGAFNYATSNFIVQGVGEALEEGFQSAVQQEAIRSAQLSARDILEKTGKDKTTIEVDNLPIASKSNVLNRYLAFMGTEDAQFEMAIGFFAGAGQRMVQSYTNQAFDSHKYNTYSKKIEALKRDLPTDTPENRQYRQQKIQELEYKRALETEKGRSESAKVLLQTLKTDVANSVKFAMDTDEFIEAAEQNGLEWVAEGIKSKAFFQLFMKHAGNATVDHLERHLKDIAEGKITSQMFPENGDAKTKAKELLTELTRIEKDFLSLRGYRGAHKILNAQENARIDQKIVDEAFAKRESNKQSIIDDLRKISKSKATDIELDLETGQVVMRNSLGKEIKLSKAMAKAIESSNAYQDIFSEGGLNDQIEAIQEKVINTRAEMSEMISKSGQARLQREAEVLEDEIRKRQKLSKTGRKSKGGKTKSDRDRNNVDNSKNRANSGQSSEVEGDTIKGSSVLTPESNPESVPKDTGEQADGSLAGQDTISALEELMGLTNIPATPKGKATSNDIKSDKEVQDAAEAAHIPNTEDNPVFGYDRGKTSNENKVASLQLEYEASVENGVITLTDTDLNKVDGYLALSDATRVQEGDTVEFRVLKGTEADAQKVRDVSDLDQTQQGKVKTVKEARGNSKKLAEHETKVSDTVISEAQIEEDITPIQIVLKKEAADGTVTETIIGYLHSPLYERKARRDNDDKTIAEDKKKLRDFRAQVLAGKSKGGRISNVRPIRLNYISKAARRSTKAAFAGLTEGPQGNYIIAYADSTGSLIVKGGSSIKSVNGLGRNANIVNLEDVQEGMAYAVVPLKKSQDGKVQYYAAPLFTRQVSVNNVEAMMTAIQGFIDKNTKLGGSFKSRLDTPDPSGLVRILKRFTRVRGTHNMLHKAGQSFIYTKTLPMPDGSTRDVIVFSKVLSEQEGGVAEVEIIQGKPLSNEDIAFVKQVLSEQYTNIDFDAVKEDKTFSTTVDADGNVKTLEGNITDYVLANTLASIEPVRTKDGKLPNGRVIFHVNPDVRFVSDIEGISSAPKPDVKPDEEPQAPAAPVSADEKADIEKRKQKSRESAINLGGTKGWQITIYKLNGTEESYILDKKDIEFTIERVYGKEQPKAETKADNSVGGEVKFEKGNKIQWNVFGNEESGEWTVGEKTKTRGGKDAVVLTKVYVEASSDGKSYTKEYADANGIKYDNERTVEHIVPLEDLQSLKEQSKAEAKPNVDTIAIEKIEADRKADLEKLGQQQLTKGFNSLSEATKPEQVADAIVNIEQNKKQGAKLSKEQEQQLSEAKTKLKEQGYEIIDYNVVRIGENTKVQGTDFYNSEKDVLTEEQANAIESKINTLEKRGEEVDVDNLPSPVSRTIKPLIKKDGKMVQAAEVNTLIFKSVEQAKEAVKKSREAGYKKNNAADKINAKYDALRDAELAKQQAETKPNVGTKTVEQTTTPDLDEELNAFNDSFEEEESGLLPQAGTNRSEETRNRFNIKGLNPTQQEQLIGNVIGDLISEMSLMQVSDRLASPEQLFDEALDFAISRVYKKFETLKTKTEKALAVQETEQLRNTLDRINKLEAAIKAEESKLIELALTRFEQQSGVSKKSRKTPKATETDKSKDRSKKIADSILGLFTKNVSKESLAIDEETESNQDEESGEAAPGINKSYHSDNFYFTLDPIDTASSRLRQSLMTLTELNPDGSMKKNFLGGNVHGDPYQVFKLLSTALDSSKPEFASQMETLIRKYLTDRGFRNAAPWLPSLVLNSATVESLQANELGKKFLEKAFPNAETRADQIKKVSNLELNPQILNEFASVMAKHSLIAPMVSLYTTSEGVVYANVFSQNRNSTTSIVKEEFEKGMRNRLYTYDAASGNYIINEEAFIGAIDFLEELYTSEGKMSQNEFRLLMNSKLGIDLSEESVKSLFEDGIKLETSKTSRRVKMTDPGMWGNRSPFNIMKAHLNEILTKKVPYTTKRPTNFGAIDRLVKVEATRSTSKRYGTTFYSGGRNIATMTSNKYFSNLLDELFTEVADRNNPEYVEKLVNETHQIFKSVFESPSQLLEAIYSGSVTREDLEFQYLNFSPLKQGSESSEDFNKLQKQEHTIVKNSLFTASVNTQRKFTTASGFTFEQRQATIVPLTFSDKDTVMALKTLVPVMDFDATGQISNKTVSLFYDHVLMSEINRIIAFSSNNANSGVDEASSESGVNNRELEEASGIFFLFPQLNNFVVQYRGEQMLLREALELYPSEAEMAEIKPSLEKELRGILLEMVDDKLQEFQENPDLYTSIPQSYKDFLREKHPRISDEAMMKMVAADITLGQTLGTSNVIQMFVGDPALYAKVSKNSDGTIDVNTTVKATYANIDKRLAALIAPGIEPSRESDNEEYIQIMVPDIKMDYDSALFEGLPDEFIKAFKEVEATDAQEFITYEEYLDNAVRFGEITKATADKIISLIQKESKGYVMTQEDKDLLKSVMFKAQKPVGVADHYTTLKGSKQTVRQRIYIKTSAVPLLPFFTRGTQLDNLRQAMERLQKDKGLGVRLTFKTGTKVGFPAASKTSNIVNKDGSIKTIDELYSMFRDGNEDGKPYVTIKRKYWRIQQSVPTKTKDETTRGTQPDALIGSGISVAPEIEPIVNKFNSNSEKLFRLRADELRNELMVDNPNTREGGKVINKEKLANLLEEVAKDRGFDFNVIEGLTIGEDGQFEIPAELSAASEQFQSMIMSIARKGIARKKVTGGSQVLMSEAMFRYQQGVQGTSDILYTNAYDEVTGLKPMRMEDGVVKPAQIIIPNRFQLSNGKTINFRKYIDETGRIDLSKLPEGALEGFGFRIPTQGYNSMAVVEVVGFLPDYMGDLVIAPRSFMVQMGSDFDVDKLYDYFFKFEEKEGQLSKIQNDNTEYGLQNVLLQNRIDILKNPKIFRLIKTPLDFGLHKFTPGSSKYTNSYDAKLSEEINRAGGVAEAIAERQRETSKTKTSIVSEFYQRGKYLEARAALDAVGVKASLNSFSAILTSTSKSIELVNPITFGKDIQVKTIVGAQTLKGSGRLKQDVISGSLSAAVDNQNEQIVNKYNLNEHTFDAHDAMELMGLEEDFSQAFLEQPIIKFIVSEVQAGAYYNVKAGILDLKLKLLTSIYKANNPNAVEIDSKALSDLAVQIESNFNNSTKDYSYDQVVSMLWENMSSEEIDLEYSYNILDKFQSFSGIMSDLRPVLRLVSSDAKGAGSSITDFVALAERADEILEDDYVTSKSMLGILGQTVLVAQTNYPKIRSLEAKGYIKGPSTSQGYIMVKPDSAKAAGSLHTFALSQDLIMSEFSGVYDIIRNTSSKSFVRPTRDTKKIIEKAIRQYVNSNPQLFSGVDRSQLLYSSEGRPSLAQIIELAKGSPELKNNPLIQELETSIEENVHHTLTFRNSAADDLVTDKHAKAFLDLLLGPNSNRVIESVNMTPNQIGRALVDYAFLTGGVKSAVDFVRFVPTSYLIDLGFYTNLKSGFNGLKTDSALKTHFVQQLLQHNPDLVQTRVKLDKNEGVSFDAKFSNVVEGIVEFTASAKFKERAGIAFEDNAFIVDPTYLYITVKPNNRPRRVLKFNGQTGRYEMMDILGTGTISEYSFGDNISQTILVENKVSNYLGVRKEEEVEDFEEDTFVEDTFEEAPPTTPGTKAPKIAKDPAKEMAALMGFTESGPLQGAVGSGKLQDGEVNDIVKDEDGDLPETSQEQINDWLVLFGDPLPAAVPTVNGTETELSSDSLAGFKSTLEANPASTVTLTEDGIESLLQEVAQSDDMAHKFLAREIIDSGVIKQKKPSVAIRSGNILDSTATSKGTKLFIDSRTTNWDFEQTLLHELGHSLTIEAIDAYQKNPASVSPEVRKALAKLNAIRQQFFVNLLEADPAEIALFNAFTNANDGADVSQTKYEDFVKKVNELKEAGDLKGLQELFYKSYGATDLKEFVTMVMSSKTFRDMLDRHFKIDLSGKVDKSFLSEMMEVLMDLFRGVLNLEKRPISQYALEQTMVVMKNEPKVNKVADVSRQPMIVKINNTNYTVTPNNLVLDKGKKVTNAGVILKAEMKVAEKQNELGKVFLSDDNTTYYVFQGFDKIKVVKISPAGTITQINSSDAKYPRIIEQAFKGGDNIITGNETVTPTAPTTQSSTSVKSKGTINVYWGQAESATSTKILSNLAPRKFTYQGKEYGSVEHAYQTLKSGVFDQITYDAYVKAGGYGTKIRGKAVTQGFDNLQLIKDLVVESFKQNSNSEAAKKLLQYENFTHNTNEIIDKAFLEGLKLAQQSLLSTQSSTSVKEGVAKLFQSSPELANSVYEAMGFEKERIRKEYPKSIETEFGGWKFETQKLLEIKDNFTNIDDGTIANQRDFKYDNLRDYGMTDNEYQYALKNQDLLSNLLDAAEENNSENNLFQDIADKFLTDNVKLIDTLQTTLFGEQPKSEITPQQKQEAQQKFQEYVNQTGKQDIQGFKKFVGESSTSVKEGVFQGYKGGFENKGKGTPEGDGKDKAMRGVATGVIVELAHKNLDFTSGSSSETSLFEIGNRKEAQKDRNIVYTTSENFSTWSTGTGKRVKNTFGKVVMLARNSEFKGKDIKPSTKEEINKAFNEGVEFVVGDMPDVDSQFIDYLQEIGAKFTVYHTGAISRIKVKEPTQSSTTPEGKAYDALGNELELFGNEIMRSEDGSLYEEFDTAEEAQKAFNELIKPAPSQPGQKRDLPPLPPDYEFMFPSGIIPLQGTVEDFLKTLDMPERREFAKMIKDGEIKTICKLA